MVEIDFATPADVPRVAELSNRAAELGAANFATAPEPVAMWQDAFEATRATHPWLVARAGGGVVGFAKASPHRARGAYAWTAELSVYLDEPWQGRRVGSTLYTALLPLLRAQGFASLLAGITAGHEPSERLHTRLGFVRCGTFRRVGWKLGGWHDVAYWELLLGTGAGAPPPLRPVAEAPLILRAPIDGVRARALIAELNAELRAQYPEEGANHFRLDESEVAPGRGAFLIARVGGEAVGCGAVRTLGDGAAEIKRMYVHPAVRGRGIAAAVLYALDLEARLLGARRLVLETGARQREAVALYRRAGFTRIEPFGEYRDSPLSLCLGKELS